MRDHARSIRTAAIPALLLLFFTAHCPLPTAYCGEAAFDRLVIDADFPEGYQVEVADVNGDGKPDIVGLGGGTCAWYENPSWTKRIITGPDRTPGIISSATTDLDGDGKAEVAIAYDFEMNQPSKGKLGVAVQGEAPGDPWTFRTISGRTPGFGSIHRLRWGRVLGGETPVLVVAPIFNPESVPPTFEGPARPVLVIPDQIKPFVEQEGQFTTWFADLDDCRPVMHAIEVRDVDGDGRDEILKADNSGVALFRVASGPRERGWHVTPLVPGAPGEAPNRGCSEVHLGRLADGRRLLATIEPWHGNQVVAYLSDGPDSLTFGPPTVLDDTLDAGHALWLADIDGDGDDEVFAGHRGKDHRVSVYDRDGTTWNRTVLDRDIAAQDLRGGDLDGDGTPDVVAIGGATHNIIWYRPRPSP